MEVREASESQEVKEPLQTEDRVVRGLVVSIRRPVRDEGGDERGSGIGVRKRMGLVEIGEEDCFSGSWTGLGIIGGRVMGINHGSGSGGGGRTGVVLFRRGRRR